MSPSLDPPPNEPPSQFCGSQVVECVKFLIHVVLHEVAIILLFVLAIFFIEAIGPLGKNLPVPLKLNA
jgi:hypothetical protein